MPKRSGRVELDTLFHEPITRNMETVSMWPELADLVPNLVVWPAIWGHQNGTLSLTCSHEWITVQTTLRFPMSQADLAATGQPTSQL